MKVRSTLLGARYWPLPFRVPASSAIMQQADTPAQSPGQAPNSTQTTTLPAQSQQPQGSAPLRVMVGKSLLINTTERLKRVSVTDPAIAYPAGHHANADSGSREISRRSFTAHLG